MTFGTRPEEVRVKKQINKTLSLHPNVDNSRAGLKPTDSDSQGKKALSRPSRVMPWPSQFGDWRGFFHPLVHKHQDQVFHLCADEILLASSHQNTQSLIH